MDFYRRAERILERVLAHKASIKTEVLAKDVGTDPDRKRMFAVIHQVLQCMARGQWA